MMKELNTFRTPREILGIIVLTGGAIFIALYLACLFMGRCYIEYTSTITELGICLDTSYHPVQTPLANVEQLYICGNVEGQTPRPGGLYLYYEGKVIYTDSFKEYPGIFHQLLLPSGPFKTGEYKVEIVYAKTLLAQATFEILPQ